MSLKASIPQGYLLSTNNRYVTVTLNLTIYILDINKYILFCMRLVGSDKVYQLLGHGWWISPSAPVSSTTKTGRHDITEILLKVALSKKINHGCTNAGAT